MFRLYLPFTVKSNLHAFMHFGTLCLRSFSVNAFLTISKDSSRKCTIVLFCRHVLLLYVSRYALYENFMLMKHL